MFSSPTHVNHLESDPFSMQMSHQEERKAAVFWDCELCPPPDGMSGTVFARRVRDLALKYSRSVFPFKAYCSSPLDETLRSELRDSHVIVLEEKQETVDKLRRAVEMLGFAMDQAPRVPGTVIFISSDVDFACVLSELRNRGHFVGLLCPEDTADSTLKGHASHVFGWNKVFRFGEDEEQISQDDSLINLDADAPSPPNQPDWARLPSSPPRALSSSTYAELRTIQHPILNDDSPRQDSGPNSPVRTRVEANASPSNQVTPPAPSDQPLYSISAFADLITALEEENREANAEEHICSKIADRIRTINPEFLIQPQLQSRKLKFEKYLEYASRSGVVTFRKMSGEGRVALNPRDMWRVAL